MEIVEIIVVVKNIGGHLEFYIDNEFEESCEVSEFEETFEKIKNEYRKKSFKKCLLFVPKML